MCGYGRVLENWFLEYPIGDSLYPPTYPTYNSRASNNHRSFLDLYCIFLFFVFFLTRFDGVKMDP